MSMMACSSVPRKTTQYKQKQCNILYEPNAHLFTTSVTCYVQLTESLAGFADGLDIRYNIKVLIGHNSRLRRRGKKKTVNF